MRILKEQSVKTHWYDLYKSAVTWFHRWLLDTIVNSKRVNLEQVGPIFALILRSLFMHIKSNQSILTNTRGYRNSGRQSRSDGAEHTHWGRIRGRDTWRRGHCWGACGYQTARAEKGIKHFLQLSIGQVCVRAQRPTTLALLSGFLGMKWLGVFLLPPEWDANPSQGYPNHQIHPNLFIHLAPVVWRPSEKSLSSG